MLRLGAALLLLFSSLSVVACATGKATITPTPGTAGYDAAAELIYNSAKKSLASSDYLQAAARFQEVRAKFPYTQYGPLAELGLADTSFAEGKYLEAVDAYRAFVRARPTHPDADYASWRIGQSLGKESPSDFFLFPPSFEKDLIEVKQAVASLDRFAATYPESEYRKNAQELLTSLRRRLADHELYVAGFYRHKGKWQGTAMRLERLLADYPGVGLDAQARVALAEAYLEVRPARPDDAMKLLDAAGALEDQPGLAAKARVLRQRIARPAAPATVVPEPEAAPEAEPETDEAPEAEAAAAPEGE